MKQTMDFIQSFLVILLVLAGISGISYHAVKDDGWVELVFGKFWDAQIRYPMIAIPLTIAAIVLGVMWRRNALVRGGRSALPTYILYGLMIAGIYFIGRYMLTGAF